MNKGEFSDIVQNEFQALDCLYFNAAYFGPSPLKAQKNIEQARKRMANPSFLPYEDWLTIPERIREKFAKLLGCPSDNIFHSSATCDVISAVAHGLELKENDLIVSLNGEYPSNVLPWLFAEKMGRVKFQMIDAPMVPDVEWLEKNLPPETKVFDISLVTFNTGRKIDILSIGQFLKSRGIFFIVDATQAFGRESLSSEELAVTDVISFSTYKWLLGPYGHAFGYLSDNILKSMKSIHASWINGPNFQRSKRLLDYTTETLPGARQFDRGQAPSMLNMLGLEGSLDLFHEIGLKNIEAHNKELVAFFLENLDSTNLRVVTPRDAHAGIICLNTKENTDVIKAKLQKQKIDVSIRDGYLRISFHLYNTISQTEVLLSSLNQI